jgi:hypothetical protein
MIWNPVRRCGKPPTNGQSYGTIFKIKYVRKIALRNMKTLKKIMFLGSKAWLVRGADNLTAIYEPIV